MKLNTGMASLLYQNYLSVNTNRYQLVLIEGGQLTLTELRNNFNTSVDQPFLGLFSTLYSTIAARGGKVVGTLDIPNSPNAPMKGSPRFQINFLVGQQIITIVNSGQPDWFLLYDRLTAANYNQDGNSVFCIRGTVTDIGGGGDMEVEGRNLDLNSLKRVFNIRFAQKVDYE